jgi:serine protease Do
MKNTKRMLQMAAVGAIGAIAATVGSSLVKDVQFARAEQQVEMAREQLQTLDDLSSAFKKVNRALENSVVHIRVEKRSRAAAERMPGFDDDAMRRFFDRDGDGEPDVDVPEFNPQATGSGVIMEVRDGAGFVVTNNHVIDDAGKITVVLNDGRQVEGAKVVGADPKTDIAVVRIEADRLIAASWGDSDKLEKGDIIVAFGSPFGYVGSMSHGIVSALNRQAGVISSSFAYENFIQVDAPINPGNSGGPLVNLRGEVVGINTAIASRSGSFSGVGFAVPSNQVRQVAESLKQHGKVVRGYLGVQIADVRNADPRIKEDVDALGFDGEHGVFVRGVLRDSPAFNILRPGDVITEIDGKPVKDMGELRNRIAFTPPGAEVKLTVWREKKTEQLTIKLAEQPDDQTILAAGRGDAAPQNPGQIGVTLATPTATELDAAGLPDDAAGALVRAVRPNSPAARVGVRPGDLITRVGSTDVKSADEARTALKDVDLAKGVRLHLLNREGEKMVTIRSAAGAR